MLKRLLKRWKTMLVIVIALLAAVLGGGQWYVSSQLTPDKLVKALEAKYNARVEVGETSVSLLSHPASFTLKSFSLLPRDSFADAGTPLAERTAIPAIKETGLGLGLTEVKFNLWALLKGKVAVEDVHIAAIKLRTEQSETGVDSLKALLGKPAVINGKPVIKKDPETKPPGAEAKANADGNADADSAAFVDHLVVNRLVIDRINMDSRSLKKRQTVSLQNTNLVVENFVLGNQSDAAEPQANVSLDGKFFLLGKYKVEMMNMGLAVKASGLKLDAKGVPVTMPVTITLKKGSRITDLPALQRMSEKMGKWEKYGLKFSAPLPDDAELLEDASLEVLYTADKAITQADFRLKLDTYEVLLKKGAEVNLDSDECKMEVVLIGNAATSQQAISDFRRALTSKLSDDVGGTLHAKVMEVFQQQKLILQDQRLSIPMGLSGPLKKPEVDDRVGDILKDALFQSIIPGGL